MCQLEGLIFSLLHDREDQIAKMLYIYIYIYSLELELELVLGPHE